MDKQYSQLSEFKNVDQKELDKGIKRRWFQNEKYTLIVWYNLAGEKVGFQLCYGEAGSDTAISWYNNHEFSHRKIDYGKHQNMAPVLQTDSGRIGQELFTDFYRYTKNLDADIVEFIQSKETGIVNRQ